MTTLIYNLIANFSLEDDAFVVAENVIYSYSQKISEFLKQNKLSLKVHLDCSNHLLLQDGSMCSTEPYILHIIVSGWNAEEFRSVLEEIIQSDGPSYRCVEYTINGDDILTRDFREHLNDIAVNAVDMELRAAPFNKEFLYSTKEYISAF